MADRNGKPTTNSHDRSPFGGLPDPIALRRLEKLTENALQFSRQFMQTVMDPRRDVEDEAGLPRLGSGVTLETYKLLYDRDAVAARVVEVLPKESWQVSPLVYEDEDAGKVTKFEEAWDELGQSLGSQSGKSWFKDEEGSPVWAYLERLDILSGIGSFGVLLLGIDDGLRLDQPVDGVLKSPTNNAGVVDSPPTKNELKLLAEDRKHPTVNAYYAKGGEYGQPVVRNFNPNHDAGGRFSDGEGGEIGFPSKHNPTFRYQNKSDRDSDDAHHDREIKRANAGVAKARRELEDAQARGPAADAHVAALQQALKDVDAKKATATAARDLARANVAELRKGLKHNEDGEPVENSNPNHDEKGRFTSAHDNVLASVHATGALFSKGTQPSSKMVRDATHTLQQGWIQHHPDSTPTNTKYELTEKGKNLLGTSQGKEKSKESFGDRVKKNAEASKRQKRTFNENTTLNFGNAPNPSTRPSVESSPNATYPSGYLPGDMGAGLASSGVSPMGTDQQYFGVQLGPPETPAEQPSKEKRRLIYMRPYSEDLVQVVRYEWNANSPRFGMPVMYRITLNDPREVHSGIGLPLATVFVHWSRLIHVADNAGATASSEIFAPPRLRPVLNNVLGLHKIYGGSPEAYWKGAVNKMSFETHPQLGGDVLIDKAAMRNEVENFQNSLQPYLLGRGGSWKSLAPAVTDPTTHVTVQLEAICIKIPCPKRVFMGTERGELASAQDDSQWNDQLRHRQQNHVTPKLICPLIDRLIMVGVLPEPGDDGYHVEWPDLDSLSDLQKAQIALQETQALAAYVAGGVEAMVPPHDYLVRVLNYTEEEADEIIESSKQHQEEQLDAHADKAEAADEHDLQPTPPPGFEAKPEPPPPMPGMPGGPPLPPQKLGAGQSLVHPQTGSTIAKGPPAPKTPPRPSGAAK